MISVNEKLLYLFFQYDFISRNKNFGIIINISVILLFYFIVSPNILIVLLDEPILGHISYPS
jgi:hypothetical protein